MALDSSITGSLDVLGLRYQRSHALKLVLPNLPPVSYESPDMNLRRGVSFALTIAGNNQRAIKDLLSSADGNLKARALVAYCAESVIVTLIKDRQTRERRPRNEIVA